MKRLGAIHDLGSMDVLCTDKTGTLTEAKISWRGSCDLGRGQPSACSTGLAQQPFRDRIEARWTTPILGPRAAGRAGWAKIDEVPFDFQRRRVSVLVETRAGACWSSRAHPRTSCGSPRRYEAHGKPSAAHARRRGACRGAEVFEDLGAEGFRALGVAWREVGPDQVRQPWRR